MGSVMRDFGREHASNEVAAHVRVSRNREHAYGRLYRHQRDCVPVRGSPAPTTLSVISSPPLQPLSPMLPVYSVPMSPD